MQLSGHCAAFQNIAVQRTAPDSGRTSHRVYIVLGVLYESYIHPITIISSLPSAGVGALLALLITRVEFSVIALIGIILLIGIVAEECHHDDRLCPPGRAQ